MKIILVFAFLTTFVINAFAQMENFDVLSYKPVKGWKKELTAKSLTLSATDDSKGTFCMINIYQLTNGEADSKTNFDNSWQKIVQDPLGAGSPKMENAGTENGWELQTGSAQFSKGGLAGIAMLITATANRKMINMLVVFNSDAYTTQVNDFIGSLELKKLPVTNNEEASTPTGHSNTPIVGIWTSNLLETSGYANGFPQYTAGYFRKEYIFKSDGTYFYSHKDWSAYSKVISYSCETGTWSANGNTLTLLPTQGKAGEWNRTSSNKEWGSLIKTINCKLEKTTYTYEIKYYSGSQSTALILTADKATERDGSSKAGSGSQTFSYGARKEALIDFPPGFKLSVAKPSSATPANVNKQRFNKHA